MISAQSSRPDRQGVVGKYYRKLPLWLDSAGMRRNGLQCRTLQTFRNYELCLSVTTCLSRIVIENGLPSAALLVCRIVIIRIK